MRLFNDFIKKRKHETLSAEEMEAALNERVAKGGRFPIEVFDPALGPFINDLIDKFNIPSCFIGLNLLHAYSTAVGSAYAVSTNGDNRFYMALWCCLNGISSSGKTMSYDMIHEPLFKIQSEFESKWDYETQGLDSLEVRDKLIKMVMFRDIQVPTLVRSILPDNPKGMCKYTDEIMEWFNTMNPGRGGKEGSDEQFWLSSWNVKPYSGVRAGKQMFTVPRPYIPVCGGIQPKILYKMFMNDRDITGFVFRVLFATPEEHRIAIGDRGYRIPKEYREIHDKAIRSLYNDVPVNHAKEEPRILIMNREAIKEFEVWSNKKSMEINALKDLDDKEIQAGILGKMNEYVIRISGILRMMDLAIQVTSTGKNVKYHKEELIDKDVMKRALLLTDYFFGSAVNAYNWVSKKVTAPANVMEMANMRKANWTWKKIAEHLYDGDGSKVAAERASREYKRMLRDYPKVFGAKNI